jgi:hypothetical protein
MTVALQRKPNRMIMYTLVSLGVATPTSTSYRFREHHRLASRVPPTEEEVLSENGYIYDIGSRGV